MITRLEKILLNVASLLTAATGLVYAWMKYLMKPADPFSVVNHPWQPTLLSAHVLVAPLLLFGAGLITREHILGRYRDPRARKGRRTGVVAALALAPMVGSGYLLQAITSDAGRRVTGLIHLASGLLFLVAYGLHLALAARKARGKEVLEKPSSRRLRAVARGTTRYPSERGRI